jgi:hypothetical protein
VEEICHLWAFPAVSAAGSGSGMHHLDLHACEPGYPVSNDPADFESQFGARSGGGVTEPGGWANNLSSASLQSPRAAEQCPQGFASGVRMYCFRLGNCGTFMPLSGVRGVPRIAVVWTRIVAAISAISSTHFDVAFTHAVIRSAVDCK